MKIDIYYFYPNYYSWKNFTYWIWYYKPYKYVKGFNVRLFGLHLNIREKNSTEKLKQICENRSQNEK